MAMLRYDYDSVLDRLKKRTLQKLNGENLILFSTNSAILEAVAEEFDDLSMYDEFLTRENVWDTARGVSSIMKQVAYFDYLPHRKTGASGYLRFSTSETFNGNWPNNISIPRFTQCSGGGTSFITKEASFLSKTASYVDVPVIQGDIVKFKSTITPAEYPAPSGTAYAQVRVDDTEIENTLYELRVNGELWKEIANIRLAVQEPYPEKALVYAVKTQPRYEGVILFFGNNMLGKSLQYGDVVEFTYLRTRGSTGNVLSAGVVTSVNSELKDEYGTPITMYCNNLSMLTGGQDYESLTDIKVNAPRSFQTGNRAISSLDYETLIKKTGVVDKVQVWGEKEINEDRGNPPGTYVEASENLIYITGYTIDPRTLLGIPITEPNKEIVRKYLNDKKGTTDILQFIETQILYVTFCTTVYVKDAQYTSEQVIGYVHEALTSKFSIYKTRYKTGLYFSDYYAAIDNASGVDHCTCFLRFSEIINFMSAYEFTLNIGLNNIKKNSVSLKVKNDVAGLNWQEIAHDDGEGNLIGSPIDPEDPAGDQFQLPGATINYLDGSIGDVIITYGLDAPFANYQIRVDFELDDIESGNLIPLSRNQIFAYYADEIQVRIMV